MPVTKNDTSLSDDEEDVDQEVDDITRGKQLTPSPPRFASTTPAHMIRVAYLRP